MSPAGLLRRLDTIVVPAVAGWVGGRLTACRRLASSSPVRLLAAALGDSGLLGPGILLVLLTGCLLGATGAS